MEKLHEINKEAAMNASRALSKLINRPVGVMISKTEVRNVEELSPVIDPEAIVAGIYVPITGSLKGASLVIFPKETAFVLCDLLVKRKPGTTRKLAVLDESVLKEMGNIICGNYFTVLANKLQMRISEHLPQLSFDMFGAIVSQIIAKFAQETEKAMIIEIEFIFESITLKGHFLLLLKVREINAILHALD